MDSLGSPPQPDSIVLFPGPLALQWRGANGGEPRWQVNDNTLLVVPGSGDLISRHRFGDAFLHLEFLLPHEPHRGGQDRANSGVFLQGRYELQLLDSWEVDRPGPGDCGALYRQAAPLLDACRAPGQWQSLDVIFRSARRDEPARLTALLNGMVIHNNLVVLGPTAGALDDDVVAPGPLRLQDHGSAVAFRNIWLLPLPAEGSGDSQDEPRQA